MVTQEIGFYTMLAAGFAGLIWRTYYLCWYRWAPEIKAALDRTSGQWLDVASWRAYFGGSERRAQGCLDQAVRDGHLSLLYIYTIDDVEKVMKPRRVWLTPEEVDHGCFRVWAGMSIERFCAVVPGPGRLEKAYVEPGARPADRRCVQCGRILDQTDPGTIQVGRYRFCHHYCLNKWDPQ